MSFNQAQTKYGIRGLVRLLLKAFFFPLTFAEL